MGNLRMNADQISYKGGEKPMSVEQAIKNAGNTGLAHTADIAPDFSTESAYSAGDYVYHNGTLYVFTSNHAAGAWSTSDTQAVNVGGEIATLMSGLTNLVKVDTKTVTTDDAGDASFALPADGTILVSVRPLRDADYYNSWWGAIIGSRSANAGYGIKAIKDDGTALTSQDIKFDVYYI